MDSKTLAELDEDRPIRWSRYYEIWSGPGRSRWWLAVDLTLWGKILAASVGPLIYLMVRQLIVGLLR